MASRQGRARRSAGEWAIRLALAAAVAVAGYYAVTFSVAQALMNGNPALAHQLAPYDGRMAAAYAASLAGENASRQDRLDADRLALRALEQDPTAAAAAATLGLNADVRGDKVGARRYFAYSEKLSRRDLTTQLWMIEDAVDRGDISAALRHYDVTLRVFPEASEILYPVLASASANQPIRDQLVATLGRKPPWGESFINFIAMQGPDPQSTAVLLSALRRAGVAVPRGADARTINALIAARKPDAAWAYYAATRPGVDRRRSRDPRFASDDAPPSQLDWMPLNNGGLTTDIQNGIFDFTAPASVGGAMLQQLQLLPPGQYRLGGHSIAIDQVEDARPYWVLRCMDGRELGRVEVPNSAIAGGRFFGTLIVPTNCPMQTLMLIARPSSAVAGLSGQLDRVELVPAG